MVVRLSQRDGDVLRLYFSGIDTIISKEKPTDRALYLGCPSVGTCNGHEAPETSLNELLRQCQIRCTRAPIPICYTRHGAKVEKIDSLILWMRTPSHSRILCCGLKTRLHEGTLKFLATDCPECAAPHHRSLGRLCSTIQERSIVAPDSMEWKPGLPPARQFQTEDFIDATLPCRRT